MALGNAAEMTRAGKASTSCFKAIFNLALTNDLLNGMLSVLAL